MIAQFWLDLQQLQGNGRPKGMSAMARRNAMILVICVAALLGLSFWQSIARVPDGSNPLGRATFNSPNALAAAERVLQEGVTDVRSHGAVGDGVTDDTAAIRAAIKAAGRYGTVFIPAGRFRFTQPIRIAYNSTEFNLAGTGENSILYPDLADSTEAAIYIGDPTEGHGGYNLHWRDFSLLAPTGKCKYGIQMQTGAHCTFSNINLCCGATEYAFLGEGVISTIFLECTTSASQSGFPYARPSSGWYMRNNAITGSKSNLNSWIRCNSLLAPSYGIHLKDVEGSYISGQWEQAGLADIWLENCTHVDCSACYTEAGPNPALKITGGNDNHLHNYFGNGTNIHFDGGSLHALDHSWFSSIEVNEVDAMVLGPALFTGGGNWPAQIVDHGRETVYYPPIFHPSGSVDRRAEHYAAPRPPSDLTNRVLNSGFSRWSGSAPADGWTAEYGAHLTQTGLGCVDPNRHFAPHAVRLKQIKQSDAGMSYEITDPNVLAHLRGRWVTFSAWMYLRDPNAVANRPSLRVKVSQTPADDYWSGVSATYSTGYNTVGQWVYHYTSCYCDVNCTSLTLVVRTYALSSATTEVIVAEPCLMVGLYGQGGWIPARNEFVGSMAVDGYDVTWAATAPTAGYHKQGAICWNTGAAAGGKAGWICVTAGTPGTWKAFGAIDP
jgi:hypothetical protein